MKTVCGIICVIWILPLIWIIIEIIRAPLAEEIPGVGFVEIKGKK